MVNLKLNIDLNVEIFSIFNMGDVLFICIIPLDSHTSKKNNRPIYRVGNRRFIGKSSKLHNQESFITEFLKQIKDSMKFESIKDDVEAEFTFFFEKRKYYTKDGLISKRMPDLSNLYELPQDCLQKAGILLNDRQIRSHDGSRIKPSDTTYLKIVLRKFNE